MDKGNVLSRLDRTSEAMAAYDAALAPDTNIPQVWNGRGEALMTLGRYTEALESFNKSPMINPDYIKSQENKNLTNINVEKVASKISPYFFFDSTMSASTSEHASIMTEEGLCVGVRMME